VTGSNVEGSVRSFQTSLKFGLLMLLLGSNVAAQSTQAISNEPKAVRGPWKQLAKLTESKGKEQDWLGWSVAVSKDGNTAAIGAVGWCPHNGFGCGQGAIFVFVKPASGWADMTQTALLTASDGQPGEYLGESVAISDDGNTIVAGAPKWPATNQEDGALYVFVRPQTGWVDGTEKARLIATDIDTNLGQSVGMSGRTIVGGAEYYNGGQGAAYVFVEAKTGWANMTQTARLTPSDGKGGAMGDSVSISGDTVVAGAPITGVGGAGNGAYVFVKPKNGWKNKTQTAKLTPSKGEDMGFGYAAFIVGDTVAVGASSRGNGNGALYVYVKPAQGWRSMTETARLTVPPKANGLGFSVSVDRNEKLIAGGAPSWQDGGGKGSVDLFAKPISGWKTTSKFRARLTATDGRNPDELGFSVSASRTTIAAGAPNATIGDNTEEGAAYVFGR
jgi:FG-GAP repeat